ncbi:MAG: ECF transporter S component [Bacteroidetes bacterium]|nr:ECF transporter S component [Bacteroidota bacterium]
MEKNNVPKHKWYIIVGSTVVIMIITMFVRIPLPSSGYFNFGDVAVVFTGLMLGKWGGAIAGGLGSALADILGGFVLFSPLTFFAKGIEGLLSGMANGKKGLVFWLLPAFGVLSMVAIYFVGEIFMPSIKLEGAVLELIPNLIQATGGYIGGRFLYEIYNSVSD